MVWRAWSRGRWLRPDGPDLPDRRGPGSVLTLDRSVRHAAAWFGLSLSVAAGASRMSARLPGLDRRRATLAVGAETDICLPDRAGQVCMTVGGGEIAYQRHAADRPEGER